MHSDLFGDYKLELLSVLLKIDPTNVTSWIQLPTVWSRPFGPQPHHTAVASWTRTQHILVCVVNHQTPVTIAFRTISWNEWRICVNSIPCEHQTTVLRIILNVSTNIRTVFETSEWQMNAVVNNFNSHHESAHIRRSAETVNFFGAHFCTCDFLPF
jgi:hypothetical protein